MDHKQKAVDLFHEGYNCAQAVFAAFSDVMGMDLELALKLSSSFGGGMGRMREVCGACSGAFMVLGALYGNSDSSNESKMKHYELVRYAAEEFKKINGSIICRELLEGIDTTTPGNVPQERTAEYYKKRPCDMLVADAAEIVERIIAEKSAE